MIAENIGRQRERERERQKDSPDTRKGLRGSVKEGKRGEHTRKGGRKIRTNSVKWNKETVYRRNYITVTILRRKRSYLLL